MPRDLQRLPKLRDSLSFLYIERAIIEQDNLSIRAIRADGTVPIPIAAMTVLMLGPGISITHAAIKAICDNGCTVIWCGETASRFYAVGMGEPEALRTCCIRRSFAWMRHFTCRLFEECMKDGFLIWIVRTCPFRKFGAWKAFA